MPTSKNRKNHSQKLKQRKQTQMNEQNQFEVPAVRSVPVWDNNAEIVMTGFEFEAIFNNLMALQTAQQAVNGIMSRNIINGVIQMDFEKISDDRQSYVPMTEEEKVPHRAEFAKAIEAAKRPQGAIIQPEKPSLVTPEGVEVTSADLQKPKAKRTPKAKVVKGNFGDAITASETPTSPEA